MRSIPLCLMFCLIALKPVEGTRLGRLEEELKALKGFIFKELGYIRDEVKEITNRVEILENSTFMHDMKITSYSIGDKSSKSGGQFVSDWNTRASHVVTAEVQNMRKAYSNDKKDLHQLKKDVKGQLRELEQKITNHMQNLTADVQQNIDNIHENISLATAALLDFINGSTTNVSILSENIKKETSDFIASTGEQISLLFNETEAKLKQNLSSTYSQYEDKLEKFLALAGRNGSEMMFKADSIFDMINANFTAVPNQLSNLSLDLLSVNQTVHLVKENLTNALQETALDLQIQIYRCMCYG